MGLIRQFSLFIKILQRQLPKTKGTIKTSLLNLKPPQKPSLQYFGFVLEQNLALFIGRQQNPDSPQCITHEVKYTIKNYWTHIRQMLNPLAVILPTPNCDHSSLITTKQQRDFPKVSPLLSDPTLFLYPKSLVGDQSTLSKQKAPYLFHSKL